MHERMCTRTCVTIAMAGWLHGFCVGACWVISPQGGFSLSLFCSYKMRTLRAHAKRLFSLSRLSGLNPQCLNSA